jgi:F-type H+-transporting ATPase subunit a
LGAIAAAAGLGSPGLWIPGLWAPIVAAGDAMSHVLAQPRHYGLFGHEITNHLEMLALSAVLLVLVIPPLARRKDLVPRGARNFLEAILQFIREEVARPALGHHTDKMVPFLWTMFTLILTANLLGMLPLGAVGGSIDQRLAHIGGTATANIAITAGLALCAFLFIHASGIRAQGVGHYFHNMFFGHAPWWLAPLMIPLEILGAFVKPFALAMRLMANMAAGHIVLATIVSFAAAGLHLAVEGSVGHLGIALVSVLGGVALSLLEFFVAFLQAYIFTFLTALFVGMGLHAEH